MKIYLVPVNEGYKLHASENKKTWKSVLEKRVEKMHEGKLKSFLEKYVEKLEDHEELTLKTAYSLNELEICYLDDIPEEEARKKCEGMSKKYFKKNMWPMILYGTLCPVTFIAAPFLPVLNWGVSFYLGYKFTSKYKGIKGYQKILSSKFKKGEIKDLESVVKAS